MDGAREQYGKLQVLKDVASVLRQHMGFIKKTDQYRLFKSGLRYQEVVDDIKAIRSTMRDVYQPTRKQKIAPKARDYIEGLLGLDKHSHTAVIVSVGGKPSAIRYKKGKGRNYPSWEIRVGYMYVEKVIPILGPPSKVPYLVLNTEKIRVNDRNVEIHELTVGSETGKLSTAYLAIYKKDPKIRAYARTAVLAIRDLNALVAKKIDNILANGD